MKISYIKPLIFLFYGSIAFLALAFNCIASSQEKAWNLSEKNHFFVGREAQLEAMRSFFRKENKSILALTGGPGFGKSQISKKYAQQFHKNYDFIWWFDAQQNIPTQLERLIIVLNTLLPPQDRIVPSTMSKDAFIDIFKNTLSVKNIKYLLIFDNTENYAQIEKYLPYIRSNQSGKHVLLTSRNPNVWVDKVEVGKFKREESLQLIKTALPKEKDHDVNNLAKTLSDYPLGLTLATGVIKSSPTMTISKYLAIHMNKAFTQKAKDQNVMLDTYSNDAETALLISLKAIEDDHPDALNALYFMSLLNSKDIPEAYIESWLKKTKSSLTSDEAIKYIYDQSLVGVSDTAEFQEDKQGDENQKIHYLSIHDRIYQLINEKLSAEEKRKLLDTAIDVLLDVCAGPSQDFANTLMHERFHLLHAQRVCENAEKVGYSGPKHLQLKVCMLEFFMGYLRDIKEARLMREQIEKDLELGISLKPYYMALFKINKGFLELVLNADCEAAIRNMGEGLALLPDDKIYDSERLRSIANLIQYHCGRGEINRANELLNQGKAIFKNSTSTIHNALFILAWATILLEEGKFEEALKVLDKARALPNVAVNYPTVYHGISRRRIEALLKQQRLKEGQIVLEEYEKHLKKFFQERYEKSFDAANVLLYKSLILLNHGKDLENVIRYLTEAQKIYKEAFKSDKKYGTQAFIHLTLGKAYQFKKDFKTALQEYLLSEEIYDLILKEKRIADVSDLYTELALLGIEMKDEGLSQKYLSGHIETFGLDHPRTEMILKELDG